MTGLMELAPTLQTLLTHEADAVARETHFVQRRSPLTGARFLQTLVFGWLHNPTASLDDLAELAADLGADITPQALDQRLTGTATHFLARMVAAALHHEVTSRPAAVPLLQRFHGVYVFDSTTRSLPATLASLFPGCGGGRPDIGQAALKCHVCLELTSGALDLTLSAGRQPDSTSALAHVPLPAGALRLADRGYFDLEVLQDYSAAGVYWISRAPTRLRVADGVGRPQRLASYLASCPAGVIDVLVTVGSKVRLAARLLARRVPPAVQAQRQRRVQRQAQQKGRKVSAEQWALCGWDVFLTNASAALLGLAEVIVLLRARWQIELLFKLWKSGGGLDKSRGQRPERVLCEVYAKLLALVVQHWTLLVCGGPCLEYSSVKAARRVRRVAEGLAVVLSSVVALVEVLTRLRERIQRRCRRADQAARCTTRQELLEPERAWVAQPPPTEQKAA